MTKTHCINGHAIGHVGRDANRHCRPCARNQQAAYDATEKGQASYVRRVNNRARRRLRASIVRKEAMVALIEEYVRREWPELMPILGIKP